MYRLILLIIIISSFLLGCAEMEAAISTPTVQTIKHYILTDKDGKESDIYANECYVSSYKGPLLILTCVNSGSSKPIFEGYIVSFREKK